VVETRLEIRLTATILVSVAQMATLRPQRQIATVSSMAGNYSVPVPRRRDACQQVEDPGVGRRIERYGYESGAGSSHGAVVPNGTTVAYGYDTYNRLRTLEHKNSVAQVIASYAYTLGADRQPDAHRREHRRSAERTNTTTCIG